MPLVVMKNDRGWNRMNAFQVNSVRVDQMGFSDGIEFDVRCYGSASSREDDRIIAVYSFQDEDKAHDFAQKISQYIDRPNDWKVLPG